MLTIFDEKPYFMLTVMMDCRAQTLERRKLVKTWKNVLPVDAKVCGETYSKNNVLKLNTKTATDIINTTI